MIEPMKAKQSLKAAELQDGDIVCFQKVTEGKDAKTSATEQESISHAISILTLTNTNDSTLSSKSVDPIGDARDFYDFLLHKRIVRFHPHPRNGNPDVKATYPEAGETFNLVLSSKHTYDQLASRVGDRLCINPTHLRFWTANISNGAVKTAVKRNQGQSLHTILNPPYSTFSNSTPRQDALYFEVLEMSLSELDTKKGLKVVWLSEGISKEVRQSVLALSIASNAMAGAIRSSRPQEWQCKRHCKRSH
jgi:ubiquitin carboxyl-terminal hydrolase 7